MAKFPTKIRATYYGADKVKKAKTSTYPTGAAKTRKALQNKSSRTVLKKRGVGQAICYQNMSGDRWCTRPEGHKGRHQH